MDFGPFPTYPVSLLLKDAGWDVNSFVERWQAGGSVPGMPWYDPNKIVHGEQTVEVINPFPVEGGRFRSVKTLRGVYDKGNVIFQKEKKTQSRALKTYCIGQSIWVVRRNEGEI